jgi:hypothetical protein
LAVTVCAIILQLVTLVVARVLVRRSWDNRVSELCYAAPQLLAETPLILSNADWKMRLAGAPHFRGYPEPDAIVVREDSIDLVWELPLICSLPGKYRTSWDSYVLEFSFPPNGKPVAKCHHGSD